MMRWQKPVPLLLRHPSNTFFAIDWEKCKACSHFDAPTRYERGYEFLVSEMAVRDERFSTCLRLRHFVCALCETLRDGSFAVRLTRNFLQFILRNLQENG